MSTWNFAEINNKFYLIKYENTTNVLFKCIISNLQATWEEEISVNDILSRANEINPVVEIELEELMKTIFQPSANMQFETANDHVNKKLLIKFQLKGGHFIKFYWNLTKCTSDSSNDLTVSLVLTLVKLKKQNSDLIDIVRKKDEEIEQHKIDGTTLTREKLITPKFNVEQFHESTKLLHSRSNEFDEILASSDNIVNLLKLCNIGLSVEQMFSRAKNNESEPKLADCGRSKKKSPTIKKRKLPQKKHLPNRGPMNYGPTSDNSDDNTNEDTNDKNQATRMLNKPKLDVKKRVSF